MFWHNRHKGNKRDINKMHKQQADKENTKYIRNILEMALIIL